LFVIVISATGLGFIGWMVTEPAIGRVLNGSPLHNGWNWPAVVALDLACIACFIALIWKLYCDWKTIVSKEGIQQPGLFHIRSIRWSDVTAVKWFGLSIHIHGPNERIVVTLYAYKSPEQVVARIGELLLAGRVQRDGTDTIQIEE